MMAGSASFSSNEDRDAEGQNNVKPSAGKITLSTVDPNEPVVAEVEVNTEWSQTSWLETRKKQIEMEEVMAVKKERDELREQLESRTKGYQSRLFGVELMRCGTYCWQRQCYPILHWSPSVWSLCGTVAILDTQG